jgi:hypothetical protein
MEERFFALTGNEFGVHLDECIRLVSLEKARETYDQYLKDYGCASLHEVIDGEIIRIKQEEF